MLAVPPTYDASIHPNLPGTAQTAVGAWFDRHVHVTRLVGVVALVFGAGYLAWRIGWSFSGDVNAGLSLMLLVAEAYGWWSLVVLTVFSWSRSRPVRPPPTPGRQVDVIVCTYDESVELLRTTLVGCRAITYPHQTYVLDDGRREEVRLLAEEMGAVWLTRPDNSHAKAGNINAALPRLTGELVFVLDADHVPLPDALDALVGYFDDADVALVQSPHDYYNHDSAQHYAVGRHEQSVFYEVVLPGKDRHNAAFWCGSATLIRRDALMGIGGVATETIAEDFHTTAKLHARGWRTRYHHEVLVQGVAPHDLDAYLLQRDRWARGNLAVLAGAESPVRNRHLTPAQRWSYLSSLISYAAPLMRLVMMLVVVLTLLSGQVPLEASIATIGGLWLPWVIVSMVAATALCRGYIRFAESIHYELCCAEIYTRALRCAVSPASTAFKVTPKEGIDTGGPDAVRKIRVVVLFGTALVTTAALRALDTVTGAGLLPDLPGFADWLVPTLALIEARRCWRSVVLVGRRRQLRGDYRFPMSLAGTIRAGDERVVARVVDASQAGVGICVPSGVSLDRGDLVEITTTLPTARFGDRPVVMSAVVQAARDLDDGSQRIGCSLVDLDVDTLDHLVECCYLVVPYERLRGTRPAPAGEAATLERSDAAVSAAPSDALVTRDIA